MGLILGPGGFPWFRKSTLLWYSCLENSMGKGAWWATVHEVTKSQTRLNAHTEREVKQYLQMCYRGGVYTYSSGLWNWEANKKSFCQGLDTERLSERGDI